MATVNLGGNLYFGVPFPLVLADRFFHIYEEEDGRLAVDVFRWDEKRQEAVYEVQASAPLLENIDQNPTGIVTFGDEEGGFLFKFRPKPGVSQIFGTVPHDGEMVVRIRDTELTVERDGQPIATFARNQFSSIPIGLQVSADGTTIDYGVTDLPEGMEMRDDVKRVYRDESVILPELVTADVPGIRGLTFENCVLRGPAVLRVMPNSGNEFRNVSFGFDPAEGPESIYWEVPSGQSKVGVIFLANCHVLGGKTEGIGFAGTREELDEVRQSIRSHRNESG